MLYNKDPTTKPGTLMNLLVCPAKLWLPGVRFLIRGSLVLLTNLLGFTQCSPEWKGFDFNFPLLTLPMIGAGAELTTCCSFCNIPDDGRDSNVRDWRLLTDIDW